MGMFDVFFQGDQGISDLEGVQLGALVSICMEHMSEAMPTGEFNEIVDEAYVNKVKDSLGIDNLNPAIIRAGVTMAVALIASAFYYYAIGMVSREEFTRFIGGRKNYNVLEGLIGAMGKTTVGMLKEMDERGVNQ